MKRIILTVALVALASSAMAQVALSPKWDTSRWPGQALPEPSKPKVYQSPEYLARVEASNEEAREATRMRQRAMHPEIWGRLEADLAKPCTAAASFGCRTK